MVGIPAGIGFLLVTLQSAPKPAQAAPSVFSRARLNAATASLLLDENSRDEVSQAPRRRNVRREMTVAGVALAASGVAMIAVNSRGLAGGATIPPGGERDGYLGKPGVVIGGALVITGIVLIVRAHAP